MNTNLNIVVVDDQKSATTLLSSLINSVSTSAEVQQFQSAEKALDWCANNRADLIFCDYEMPTMNGLQFAKELRRREATRYVPMVLVTVNLDANLRLAAYEAEIDDIFTKPVNPKELQARVRRLLAVRDNHLQMERRLDRHEGPDAATGA